MNSAGIQVTGSALAKSCTPRATQQSTAALPEKSATSILAKITVPHSNKTLALAQPAGTQHGANSLKAGPDANGTGTHGSSGL